MAESVRQVRLDELDTTRNLRRDLGDIERLTDSVTNLGVLQPITVAPAQRGGFVVVCGHRRVAAARAAGHKTITAVFRPEMDAAQGLVAMLVENLQREDLNPLDEAQAYEELAAATDWSQNRIAHQVGRSKGHVSRRRSLLRLPPPVQDMIRDGQVTTAHAYQLSRLVSEISPDRLTQLASAPPGTAQHEPARHPDDGLQEDGHLVLPIQNILPDQLAGGIRDGGGDPDRRRRANDLDTTISAWQNDLATRDARRAETYRQTGLHLQETLTDQDATDLALRALAYELLRPSHDADPLLRGTERDTRIANATTADLARAFLRDMLTPGPDYTWQNLRDRTSTLLEGIRPPFPTETP